MSDFSGSNKQTFREWGGGRSTPQLCQNFRRINIPPRNEGNRAVQWTRCSLMTSQLSGGFTADHPCIASTKQYMTPFTHGPAFMFWELGNWLRYFIWEVNIKTYDWPKKNCWKGSTCLLDLSCKALQCYVLASTQCLSAAMIPFYFTDLFICVLMLGERGQNVKRINQYHESDPPQPWSFQKADFFTFPQWIGKIDNKGNV